MNNSARVQEIVTQISEAFHRIFGDTASLIWFGSWVTGKAHEYSDIDLAIKSHSTLDDEKIWVFQQYLSGFPTLYQIDLVDMRYASEHLKREIDRHGKMI